MVAGMEDPSSGAILLDGELVNDLRPRRRRTATLFREFTLRPQLTVSENVAAALRLSGIAPVPPAKRVASVTSSPGAGNVLACTPSRLASGQLRRVATGRTTQRLFLMDDPLSNLDCGLRAEWRAEIAGLVRELGVSTMYGTHDQAEALTMADRVAIMRKGVLQDVGTPTQVYGRPANLYVAAFLGGRRMNLLEASVHVHLDRHVVLNLGEQSLHLPWDDIRSRAVAHHHGERIVVGMRAEALTPVAPDAAGNVLRGRVRRLEPKGHESLAFLDIGATTIVVDELCEPVGERIGGSGPLRRFGHVVQRLAGRASEPTPVADGTRPIAGSRTGVLSHPERHHHRPAELAVRLAPYPAVSVGHPLTLSVRTDALHFFDERGDRIDVGWR
jgi:multiple sugar transport system ATP-binding protein